MASIGHTIRRDESRRGSTLATAAFKAYLLNEPLQNIVAFLSDLKWSLPLYKKSLERHYDKTAPNRQSWASNGAVELEFKRESKTPRRPDVMDLS